MGITFIYFHIGIYLTVSMAVASVSVILTVLVMKLHHCAPQQKRVPKWIRIVVLGILAKLVRCDCTSGVRTLKVEFEIKKHKSMLRDKMKERQKDTTTKLFSNIEIKEDIDESDATLSDNDVTGNTPKTGSGHNYFTDVQKSLNVPEQSSSNDNSDSIIQKTTSEILKYLKYLVAKSDDTDAEEDIISEWKQVALVVDRLMFWTFLLITIVSTLVILVFVPVSAYDTSSGL